MNKKATGTHLNMKKSKTIINIEASQDPTLERVPNPGQAGEPFSHDQLLAALYWIHDAMDRGSVNFCVIGKTADSIINNKDLYGDKVEIAVRKNEWNAGGKNIVDAFALPEIEGETEHGLMCTYNHFGTPIELYILEDSATLTSPNQIIYHAEYFKFPNTLEQFEQEFPWLK